MWTFSNWLFPSISVDFFDAFYFKDAGKNSSVKKGTAAVPKKKDESSDSSDSDTSDEDDSSLDEEPVSIIYLIVSCTIKICSYCSWK